MFALLALIAFALSSFVPAIGPVSMQNIGFMGLALHTLTATKYWPR